MCVLCFIIPASVSVKLEFCIALNRLQGDVLAVVCTRRGVGTWFAQGEVLGRGLHKARGWDAVCIRRGVGTWFAQGEVLGRGLHKARCWDVVFTRRGVGTRFA